MFDFLAFRIYFGTAPVFAFSVIIYAAQAVALFYIFRRLGILAALGQTALVGIVSYSGYELAFKLSFLLFGADRLRYFLSYDLYPTALFIFAIASVLAVKSRFNGRTFAIGISAFAMLWLVWLLSGNYPLEVQAYELNPTDLPLLFNFLTKLVLSVAFVIGSATAPISGRVAADRPVRQKR